MKTIEEFERAYESLGDALVKHVSLSFKPTKRNQPDIIVVLECFSALIDYEWVHLELRFSEVQEFRLLSTNKYCLTVVENFSVTLLDNVLFFSFVPMIVAPETMDEHRDSLFYIACKSFDYQEVAWPED
jgi:hypothetical protein